MIINQLKRHEGLKLKPYRCTAGKLTIGYGRNLEDVGITQQEAELMLVNDIEAVIGAVQARVNGFSRLNDARQGVLINMAFNLGINGLMKFKKFLAAVECGDYELASTEMLDSNWARQVGNRALELSKQMRTGVWQ